MIKLTNMNGKSVYINPEHVTQVSADKNYTIVILTTHDCESWLNIVETPEEVVKKLIEYKMADSDLNFIATMYHLAGLE